MISREFRSQVSALTSPAANVLRRAGVPPHALTLAGLVLSAGSACAFAVCRPRLGGLLLLAAGLGDVLDGPLARAGGGGTPFGAFLDSTVDRYAEFLVFLGLLYGYHAVGDSGAVLLVYAALLGSVMVSYTRARAESIIGRCDVGLMERPERIVALIVGSLAGFLVPALWVVAVGANLTALQRIVHTWRETRRAGLP